VAYQKLKGLVLMGGKSTRMGTCKAYLHMHDRPQWQVVAEVLAEVTDEIYFSVAADSEVFMPDHSRIIRDQFFPGVGPLGGVLSALNLLRSPLFVLACDLPDFSKAAARYLFERRSLAKIATAPTNSEGLVEPLCAIYEPMAAPLLTSQLQKGRLCLRRILGEADIERVSLPKPQWINNLNHRHELLAWQNKDGAQVSKTVKLRYFASMREATRRHEEVFLTKATSVKNLFQEVAQKYQLKTQLSDLKFAKNEVMVDPAELLADGDLVVFIPPVNGG
jgi:molybdopterin-guanine dinucleotide biosynthesis protein A/molybdopterin converting factor small subunit